ncbi:NnrU family protein [Ensifer sp. IC4062]|nr:NnrU family protein [Ensifer sp. IC4062]MCA1439455.1 NnrU family protein [Ensifer sp. IC4062]
MFVLILGLLIFLGVHSVRIFAPDWRNRRIAAMGDGPWRGLYSLTALIGFALIVWGFAIARQDAPILYEPPDWTKHVALALMLFAFISLAVFVLPAGRLKPVLKHPMLISVKIWALAHLLANGDLASLLLFGAFLSWAVADRISVKRRGDKVPAPGPAKWDLTAAIAGVLLYVLFVWRLHEWLIGVTPLP